MVTRGIRNSTDDFGSKDRSVTYEKKQTSSSFMTDYLQSDTRVSPDVFEKQISYA